MSERRVAVYQMFSQPKVIPLSVIIKKHTQQGRCNILSVLILSCLVSDKSAFLILLTLEKKARFGMVSAVYLMSTCSTTIISQVLVLAEEAYEMNCSCGHFERQQNNAWTSLVHVLAICIE